MLRKKCLLGLIIVSMLIPVNCFASMEMPSFWAKEEVAGAIASSIVFYKAHDYTSKLNRLEFSQLSAKLIELLEWDNVYNLDEKINSDDKPKFDDVEEDKAINVLYSMGIVEGRNAESFQPDKDVTRQEAAKIFTKIIMEGENQEFTEDLSYFQENKVLDENDIDEWAKPYVAFIMDQGIMKGNDKGEFSPKGDISYEEALITLYRIGNYLKVPIVGIDESYALFEAGIHSYIYLNGAHLEYVLNYSSEDKDKGISYRIKTVKVNGLINNDVSELKKFDLISQYINEGELVGVKIYGDFGSGMYKVDMEIEKIIEESGQKTIISVSDIYNVWPDEYYN